MRPEDMPLGPVAAIVAALAQAATADAFDDEAACIEHVEEAAQVLLNIYASAPVTLPAVFEVLVATGPMARCGDLAAAADMAGDTAARLDPDECRPPLLDPEWPVWLALALAAHPGADADRVTAALAVDLTASVRSWPDVTRPGGLPVPDGLRDLVGAATSADLEAGADVWAHSLDASRQRLDREHEFLELVRRGFEAGGAAVFEAIDHLIGDARQRAEVLLAELPAVVAIGRTV